MSESYRDIWIGAGVAVAIAIAGAVLFRNVPAAMQATGLVGLVVGVIVRHAIYERELQDNQRD
jgi:multidrug transporter EmrE-like cation transporter